jgi:hypothetical protein
MGITMAIEDVEGVDDHDERAPDKLQMLRRLDCCFVAARSTDETRVGIAARWTTKVRMG